MGSSHKIVSGIFWSTITNLINAIYGFVAVPLLINHFGKEEYGIIGLAMSVNVYMQLMDLGFNSTNVRFYSTWLAQGNHERLRKGFQTSLSFYGVIGLLNAMILVLVAFFSQHFFNVTPEQDVILKNLFYILAVSAFCSWYSSCFDQVIKATENIAWIQKRTLLTKILMIFVLFFTVLTDISIELYYALTCLATLVIVPLSYKKIRRDIPFLSFLPSWDRDTIKEMLPYMLNIFSFGIFQFSFYNLRPVFLGIQGTMSSVADYRILNGIIGVVTMLGGAFTGILLPSTSKIVAQNNKNAYYKMAYKGTKYISILICFCCFGMMSVGREVLLLYVGEEYLYLLPWFCLWLLCTLGTHNQAISSLILSGSDIRAISYSSVIASTIGLLVCWLLIPIYGVGGTIIAFAVYLVIQLTFYYTYYWPRKMNINSWTVFCKSFFPCLVVGMVTYFITILLSFDNIIIALIAKASLFFILYTCISYVLMDKEDREFIKTQILKR